MSKITKLVVKSKSNLNLTSPHLASFSHLEPKENEMLNWKFLMRLHHKIGIKFHSDLLQGADFERKLENSKLASRV